MNLMNKHQDGTFKANTNLFLFIPSHQMAQLYFMGLKPPYMLGFCPCYLASDLKAIFFL